MIIVHKASQRGTTEIDWLHSRHSFSFGDYYDPKKMNFGALRVLNDDIIEAGQGFGSHGHKDMEIVTIMLEGELEHKDSTGGHGVIKVGEVQHMSAGRGIVHSEFNASKTKRAALLQIWVSPRERGITPRYEQKEFHLTRNALRRVVDSDMREGALPIHQDSTFWIGEFDPGVIPFNISKPFYLFVISGNVSVNEHKLSDRDAIGVSDEDVTIKAESDAKILIIELPSDKN